MSFRDADRVSRKFTPKAAKKGKMPIASPYKIRLYTQCPNKSLFTTETVQEQHPQEIILSDMIKYGFIRHAMKPAGSKPPGWKAFVQYVDKFRIRHARIIKEDLSNYYRESEWILSRLQKWYYDYYLARYAIPGYINIPVVLEMNNLVFYKDFLDIVTVNGDKVTIFDFEYTGDKLAPALKLRILNDIEVMARIWGVFKLSGVKIDKYVRIFISDKSLKAQEIELTESYFKRAQTIISYIIDGMSHRVFYPAYSILCNSCKYRKGCRLIYQ